MPEKTEGMTDVILLTKDAYDDAVKELLHEILDRAPNDADASTLAFNSMLTMITASMLRSKLFDHDKEDNTYGKSAD